MCPPLHLGVVAIKKGAFWSPSTTVANFTFTNFIFNKLATLVEGDPKAPFSIATTLRCREGRNSIPWIAQLYSWPDNAEC